MCRLRIKFWEGLSQEKRHDNVQPFGWYQNVETSLYHDKPSSNSALGRLWYAPLSVMTITQPIGLLKRMELAREISLVGHKSIVSYNTHAHLVFEMTRGIRSSV